MAADDVEVPDAGDPGVDDRDVGVYTLVDAVDQRGRRDSRPDPADPGRVDLGLDLDPLVRDHGRDCRVAAKARDLVVGQGRSEPLDPFRVRSIDSEADLERSLGGRGRGVRAALVEHDPAAVRVRRTHGRGSHDRGRADDREEQGGGHEGGDAAAHGDSPAC